MAQSSGISLLQLLDAQAAITLYDDATAAWHRLAPTGEDPNASGNDLTKTLAAQHLANFQLWHLEDEARSPYAIATEIAQVKRSIDPINQRRNDLMERVDALLFAALHPHGLPSPSAPLHSETPGMILDRLSILSLKIFHTREEAERKDALPLHVRRNRERLAVLEEQRADLAGCLTRLWEQVVHGNLRFKIYRQLKMYNDPALNPVVYRTPRG